MGGFAMEETSRIANVLPCSGEFGSLLTRLFLPVPPIRNRRKYLDTAMAWQVRLASKTNIFAANRESDAGGCRSGDASGQPCRQPKIA
jgi:hypothetical protein